MNSSVKAMMPVLLSEELAANMNMDGINRSNCSVKKLGFKKSPAYLVVLGKSSTSDSMIVELTIRTFANL